MLLQLYWYQKDNVISNIWIVWIFKIINMSFRTRFSQHKKNTIISSNLRIVWMNSYLVSSQLKFVVKVLCFLEVSVDVRHVTQGLELLNLLGVAVQLFLKSLSTKLLSQEIYLIYTKILKKMCTCWIIY